MRLSVAVHRMEGTASTAPHVVGVLPGEGVGPEVVGAALDVLDEVSTRFDTKFDIRHGVPIGSTAVRRSVPALTGDVTSFCESVFAERGALLCGPVGGRFVYELRSQFELFCKLTPLRPIACLAGAGVLRADAVRAVDVVMVRENTGGLYFADEHERRDDTGIVAVEHRYRYERSEVERILRVAVEVARSRRRRVELVVKPGGLERMSSFWAGVLEGMAADAGVETSVVAVDNAAYRLLARARDLDVVVSPNMIGDVLADCGGLLLGSRGMTYSGNFAAGGAAVFQTGHGAAYDLAGRDQANPVGQIASMAMMLRESYGLEAAAHAVEAAIDDVLERGYRTADIAGAECTVVGTRDLGERIAGAIASPE